MCIATPRYPRSPFIVNKYGDSLRGEQALQRIGVKGGIVLRSMDQNHKRHLFSTLRHDQSALQLHALALECDVVNVKSDALGALALKDK